MRTILFVIALQLNCAAAADLAAVIKNPYRYHQQRVTVTGYALGEGPAFEVFAKAADMERKHSQQRSIYVVANGRLARLRGYSLHKVRITGVIDANRHGVWGNACELALESLNVLPAPPAPRIGLFGTFRNERSGQVIVFLYDRNGVQANFGVAPGQSFTTPIHDGTAEIFTASKRLIARQPLNIRIDRGTVHYRISERGLEKMISADPNAKREARQPKKE